MTFRVELDDFRGPLDLLLYLVRKHELDILDLPIAKITDQFLQHISVLEQLDVNFVGDFLEMASTLVELKSRMVLPRGGEVEEEVEVAKQELVQKLLEYKKFKDAASLLEERSRQWQQRFPRLTNDLAEESVDPAEQPLAEVELWDLVSAFGRILKENASNQPASVIYDDTPIHVHMQRVHAQLIERGRIPLSSLFQPGQHKSRLIGIFLAVLELVRHHGIQTEQPGLFGELWIALGAPTNTPQEFTPVDTYEHGPAKPDSVPEPDIAAVPAMPDAQTDKPVKKKRASRKKKS